MDLIQGRIDSQCQTELNVILQVAMKVWQVELTVHNYAEKGYIVVLVTALI